MKRKRIYRQRQKKEENILIQKSFIVFKRKPRRADSGEYSIFSVVGNFHLSFVMANSLEHVHTDNMLRLNTSLKHLTQYGAGETLCPLCCVICTVYTTSSNRSRADKSNTGGEKVKLTEGLTSTNDQVSGRLNHKSKKWLVSDPDHSLSRLDYQPIVTHTYAGS